MRQVLLSLIKLHSSVSSTAHTSYISTANAGGLIKLMGKWWRRLKDRWQIHSTMLSEWYESSTGSSSEHHLTALSWVTVKWNDTDNIEWQAEIEWRGQQWHHPDSTLFNVQCVSTNFKKWYLAVVFQHAEGLSGLLNYFIHFYFAARGSVVCKNNIWNNITW